MSLLTTREKEIVLWTAEGKSAPEIATLLGISKQTVKNTLQTVYLKLDIRCVALLVRWAVRNGIVEA